MPKTKKSVVRVLEYDVSCSYGTPKQIAKTLAPLADIVNMLLPGMAEVRYVGFVDDNDENVQVQFEITGPKSFIGPVEGKMDEIMETLMINL